MARLTPETPDEGSKRGQLLLVTAFTLAVLFVTLGAVLNAAVTVETTAARDQGVAVERDVARYQHTASEEVSSLVVWVNHHNDSSYDSLWTALDGSVANWSGLAARHAAVETTGTSVELNATTNGSRLVQDDPDRQLRNESNETDWPLATDAKVRRFQMNLSRDSLESYDLTDTLLGSDAYNAEFTGTGGNTWNVFVYRESGTSDVVVETVRDDGSNRETCELVSAPANVSVDVTGGTIEGKTCDALARFAPGVSAPYDVVFENGDDATGTYELVVDGGVASIHFDGQPYTTPAIYAATIRVSYRTPETTYVTTVRVAPGEPA